MLCRSEVQIHRVGVWSVNLNFFHNFECGIKFALGECLDLGCSARLLTLELVTWECQYFESLPFELLMDFHHFFVVLSSCRSFGCHIDDHNTFVSAKYIGSKIY